MKCDAKSLLVGTNRTSLNFLWGLFLAAIIGSYIPVLQPIAPLVFLYFFFSITIRNQLSKKLNASLSEGDRFSNQLRFDFLLIFIFIGIISNFSFGKHLGMIVLFIWGIARLPKLFNLRGRGKL